jgi:hypothetical protein
MGLILLPGLQPIALLVGAAALLFTFIPGLQPFAFATLALAF